MFVADALAGEFSKTTRSRGDDYAANGRVRLYQAEPGSVEATVRGTDLYAV